MKKLILSFLAMVFAVYVSSAVAEINCPTDAQIAAGEAQAKILLKEMQTQYQPQILAIEKTVTAWNKAGCDGTPNQPGCPTQAQYDEVSNKLDALEKQYETQFAPQITEIQALMADGGCDIDINRLQLEMNALKGICKEGLVDY